MDKRPLNVEWHIAHSDAEWERLQGARLPESEPAASRQRPLQRYLWRVAALLLLLATGGSGGWRSDQTALPASTASGTAQQETRPWAQHEGHSATSDGDAQSGMDWWYQHGQEADGLRTAGQAADPVSQPMLVAVVDGRNQLEREWWRQFKQAYRGRRPDSQSNEPDAYEDITVQTVEFADDRAVACVITMTTRRGPAYRQTWFYRHRAGGWWLRTAPDAALWGPERSLDTLFVTFHYRQQDEPAVSAVAPQVNNLYATLRRNLGLPLKAWEEKVVIEVSVTQPPGGATPWLGVRDTLRVPLPAVYLAPVELTDAELMAQAIALPLLEQVLAQASEHHAIGAAWQPLLDGLRLWQVWELDLPLAAWREDVVTWLYVGLPTTRPGQPLVLPERYPALCAAHRLWMVSPVQLHIPLLCAELDRRVWYIAGWQVADFPRHLAQLAALPSAAAHRAQLDDAQPAHPGQAVALATLIEYAVATYGRERLPALVVGLGHYDTWDTLLPAVFGVSTAEFEAGWQAYLADGYAVPVDPAR